MGSESSMRARRVAEALRKELALLLVDGVKDPGVVGTVVTRIEMAPDLRSARVHVRRLEPSLGDQDDWMEALSRASGMLRREVTRRLGLRFAPDLRFVRDEGADASTRIEELLAEIRAERRP